MKMEPVELLATIGTILGYFLVTTGILGVGFTISAISQVLWLVWAGRKEAWGIIVVNACLLLSSLNGIWRM
jgi:hypothetical protein